MSDLTIAGHTFHSRLILGSGKFSDHQQLADTVKAAQTSWVTVALKRLDAEAEYDDIITPLRKQNVNLLPNTSGARTAKEAIFAAELAREALGTSWIKLEIHPDVRHLLPDPIETLKAAEQLVKLGFYVMPYVHADPILCKRLEEVGCVAVMPLAAPIGSNLGLRTRDFIELIIDQSLVPVIIDAGIGSPSDAALAMELGVDAIMLNTAISAASNPVDMAQAFFLAIKAGRLAFEAGLAERSIATLQATSPLTAFLD